MSKKILSTFATLACVFSLTTQISKIATSISSACSYVCCEHDGDLWSW